MPRRIPLTKGQFALVDDADYAWLRQWRWRLNSKGYAVRSIYVHGKEVVVNMRRIVLPGQLSISLR